MNAPTGPSDKPLAVIVVWDTDLAVALEMSMIGAGFATLLPDAAADLCDLPLETRSPLIICGKMLPKTPRALIAAMRARGWRGLGLVVTQNADLWVKRFEPSDRFAVLEMPFMSHDLIGKILDDGVASEPSRAIGAPRSLVIDPFQPAAISS